MPQIIGREAECKAVEEFLELHARQPGPRTVVVRGEAGIGKTTLWRHAVEQAGRAFHVLAAHPAEAESQLGFTVLADLLAQVSNEAIAKLPGPQRLALEVALLRADPVAHPPEPRAIAMGLLGALRACAVGRPVVVAIDDLQWTDAESMAALDFALRRLTREPIAILVTWRDAVANAALPDAWPLPTVLQVGPLSAGALRRLLVDRLGVEQSRPELRRLSDASRGNPFVALELAAAVARRGAPGADGTLRGPVPSTTESAILERLAPLSRQTTRALLELAAAGSLPDSDPLSRALGPARAAGVVVLDGARWAFSHPLIGTAVYDAATMAERRAAHERLASRVARPEERSRHLALSTDPPDERVAADLDTAADAAAARGASATAGELLELAARFTPPDRQALATRRVLAAADAMNRAGDGARALRLVFDELERLPAGSRERARALIWLTDSEHTVARGIEAVAAAGAEADLLAVANSALSECYFHEGQVSAALSAAEAGLDAARRSGRTEVIVRALAHVGFLSTLSGTRDGRPLLLEGMKLPQGGDPNLLYHGPRTSLAVLEIWCDDHEAARASLEDLVDLAARRGDDWVRNALMNQLFKVEWRAGNRDRVRELAEELEDLNATGGWPRTAISDWQQGLALAGFGELAEARRLGLRGLALSAEIDDRLFHLYHRSLLGFVEVSAGDASAALVHLHHFARDLAAIGINEPGVFCTSSDELEALVAAGELDQAERRVAEIEARGRQLDRPRELDAAYRGRALFSEARGDSEAGVRWAARAVEQHERFSVPLEHGRSLLVLGTLRRRTRRRSEARKALELAAALFDRVGAAVWSTKATDELARIGGRGPATDVLTPSERRVAALAAAGMTTREVAERLVVSPKTVEGHLGRAYVKLGVRSRAELARHPDVDDPARIEGAG